MIDGRPAAPEEKAELLALMRSALADEIDSLINALGITWSEFERLYASRGEVRESNEGARSLYECEGLVTTSTLPEIGFVVMRRPIGGEPAPGPG